MGSRFFCIVENFLWIYIVVCEKISNFAQLKNLSVGFCSCTSGGAIREWCCRGFGYTRQSTGYNNCFTDN